MREKLEYIFENLESKVNYDKKFSRISKIHKYWSRKPWYIIEKYIEQYSSQGDTILDPFCGSGSTGIEAILKGRNFIGTDLNPMSVLVSQGSLDMSTDLELLKQDYSLIEKRCKKIIQDLYKSNQECHKCGNPLVFTNISIGPQYTNMMPAKLHCSNCNSRSRNYEIDRDSYLELYPSTLHLNSIKSWVPEKEFPKAFYKDRFSYKGISRVSDMYTSRNLYALGFILDTIKSLQSTNKNLLLLAFTNTVLHSSKLKSNDLRPLGVNNYWIPDDFIEENVWFRFETQFKNLLIAKETLLKRKEFENNLSNHTFYQVSKESALNISLEQPVDYIFTDPPYGDAIQYSELSFVWNAWIESEYETEEEVIINPKQNKSNKEFKNLLDSSLIKIYSLLKEEGYFTLCFQNKDSKVWADVMSTCRDLGLTLYDVKIYDTFGHSYNKGWATFSPKADIYVTFKKTPTPESSYVSNPLILEDIIQEVLNYMHDNKIEIDVIKAYDATISLLIWNYFFNKEIDFENSFNIKKFQKIIDEFLKNKKYDDLIDKDSNQLTFNL